MSQSISPLVDSPYSWNFYNSNGGATTYPGLTFSEGIGGTPGNRIGWAEVGNPAAVVPGSGVNCSPSATSTTCTLPLTDFVAGGKYTFAIEYAAVPSGYNSGDWWRMSVRNDITGDWRQIAIFRHDLSDAGWSAMKNFTISDATIERAVGKSTACPVIPASSTIYGAPANQNPKGNVLTPAEGYQNCGVHQLIAAPGGAPYYLQNFGGNGEFSYSEKFQNSNLLAGEGTAFVGPLIKPSTGGFLNEASCNGSEVVTAIREAEVLGTPNWVNGLQIMCSSINELGTVDSGGNWKTIVGMASTYRTSSCPRGSAASALELTSAQYISSVSLKCTSILGLETSIVNGANGLSSGGQAEEWLHEFRRHFRFHDWRHGIRSCSARWSGRHL